MAQSKILLSFAGTNDAGKLLNQQDGAILTALKNEKFDEVVLIWNQSKVRDIYYSNVVEYLSQEIKKKYKKIKVTSQELFLKDVTDHNEIYTRLFAFTGTLKKESNLSYTAAISSGTPAMQVCWILLAESGDFSNSYPLRLIKIKDPKFGKSQNVEVKLETSLPQIIRLKEELDSLKQNLIPIAVVNIERGILAIGNNDIDLTPIEFCHYRYFAERTLNQTGPEKISGISMPISFMQIIYSYHEESFPNLDLNRHELRNMIKDRHELSITTFRANISKINKKIKLQLNNPTLSNYFQISIAGKRGAKFYGIKALESKIKVIS